MTYDAVTSEYWREIERKRHRAVSTDGCTELTCPYHGAANAAKRKAISLEIAEKAAAS